MKFVLTCEHGGNKIPPAYATLFKEQATVLESHRGIDIGAYSLFSCLKTLANFSMVNIISRLLIELNRSLKHPKLFSEFTRNLSKLEKEFLIYHYYQPYRAKVTQQIANWNPKELVFHLSVHTFTPVYKNQIRNCDIGILYDSKNNLEKKIALQLKKELLQENPQLVIRFNYPYKGNSDGFTKNLRNLFPKNYAGIELEVNQKFSIQNHPYNSLQQHIYNALKNTLDKN